MTDDNLVKLPLDINIDLDEAVKPEKDTKKPFRFKVGGRTLEMKDPGDLDWRDLLMLSGPSDFLNYALEKDDRRFLYEQPIPGWKFNQLMEAYYLYYDLEGKMKEAQRQQALSGGVRTLG